MSGNGRPAISSIHDTPHKPKPRQLRVSNVAQQTPEQLALQRAVDRPAFATPGDILNLQRTAGNRAVSRLVQTKLTVGPAGDKYEQEADAVAEKVLRMPVRPQTTDRRPQSDENVRQVRRQAEEEALQMQPEEEEELQMKPLAASITPIVQRQPEEEEELQMKPAAQRYAGGGFEADAEFERQLSAARGGGTPLPAATRRFMEPRFGSDFSKVRVHTGSQSVQLNRDIGAQAFTRGSDVFFGAGKYNPGTTGGKRLLAHELTHVVQQTGEIRRQGEEYQLRMGSSLGAPPVQRMGEEEEKQRQWHYNPLFEGPGEEEQTQWHENPLFKGPGEEEQTQWHENPLFEGPGEAEPTQWHENPLFTGPGKEGLQQDMAGPPPLPPRPRRRMPPPLPPRPRRAPPPPAITNEQRRRQLEMAKGITTDESYSTSDALGSGLGVVENITGISGLFGTEGKGNTGWVDVGPRLKDSFAGRADAQVSGWSDMFGGAAGYLGGGVSMYQGMEAFSDPEADKADKTAAALDIGSGALGSFAGTQKAFAGGMDAFNAGGQSSIFGSGLPASSDVKYIGDWAGVGAGGLGFLSETVKGGKQFSEYVGDVKSGKYASKKKGGRGGWSHARAFGRGLRSAGRWGSTGVVTAREATKLVGQLQGGGSLAGSSMLGAVQGLSTAAGALGVATGGMEMMAGGYRGYKAYQRHKMLKGRAAAGGDEKQQAALQHLIEIQKKRGKSAGISFAQGTLGALSGALTLSGFGAIPGLAIGAASGLFSLGRWGFRKFKQKMRDKAAKRDEQGKQKNWFLNMFNAEKSTKKKSARNLETARTLLEANDLELLRSIGLTPNELNRPIDGQPPTEDQKLKRIMKALRKR